MPKRTNGKRAENIAKILKNGGIGVLPTDTLYGLVGRAEDKKAVSRVKKLKQRSAGKPFIVLISGLKDLTKFKIKLDKKTESFLKTIWPGPVSIILESKSEKFKYLHLGKKTLAFRWPKNELLNTIIKQTGPLVAPSANPEGSPPAETTKQAKKYFGNQVDFYLSAGKRLSGQPSTLIKLTDEKIEVLRQGRYRTKHEITNQKF
jgi:L-threonylcarbamoyladenylate synthase